MLLLAILSNVCFWFSLLGHTIQWHVGCRSMVNKSNRFISFPEWFYEGEIVSCVDVADRITTINYHHKMVYIHWQVTLNSRTDTPGDLTREISASKERSLGESSCANQHFQALFQSKTHKHIVVHLTCQIVFRAGRHVHTRNKSRSKWPSDV